MDGPSEQELLDAARAGDRAALEQLLERHQQSVYRFGMKMCRHPEDAEDVLQDTLLSAARSIGDFRGASSLSTWLFTIARSHCIKKRRQSKFAPKQATSLEQDVNPGQETMVHPDRTPDELAAGREIQDALQVAIQALDSEQREILVLRDVEGLKASEVAEILGLSVAAVKSRLHRARVRVRELMAPVLGVVLPGQASPACPDVLLMYSKHLEGEISADLCSRMEQHLETCERCRSTCDSLKQTLALCSQLPSQEVPSAVQESVRTALRRFLQAPS